MAKTYLGKKLQELGHIENVVPEDKIVIVKEKDEGVLNLSEFFFYVKENLDFSNYVTIKDARETYARRDSVYTKDVSDARYAFIDRVYTRTASDDKYALKGTTHSKEYIDISFPLKDDVYTRENTYSKQEAFNIFALKTDIPILPDLRPYTTTVDGDKRWANINQSYTKVQTDGLYPLKSNTYSKLESDDIYAIKANTYTKDEVEVKFLNTEEGYNRTFINSNFYYKTDVYTRDESNVRFPRRDEVYTIAAVNDQFASKSWVYSRADALATFPLITKTYNKTEVNALIETRAGQTENELRTGYYSKIAADVKFANITDVYSIAQADNQFAPRGTSLTESVIRQEYYTRDVIDGKFTAIDFSPYLQKVDAAATYAPKTTVYTKTEADGRYINSSSARIRINGSTTDTYSTGLELNNNHETSDASSSILWNTNGVRSGMWYLSGGSAAGTKLNLYLRHIDATWSYAFSVTTTRIWHKAYGYLDDYFAKATDSYKQPEIDSKLAAAAALVYTKSYIDSTLYTQTTINNKLTALSNTLSAAIIAHAYTKAQTDASYATIADVTTKYALKSSVYTKTETDTKYVPLTKYAEDLAVISNDNYLGLVLNGHAKNAGRVGVSNLQVVNKPNSERIIELVDPMQEAVLATNIRPRLDSKLVLNALARYKNNPTVSPSIRFAFRYFDVLGTELKTVNLPDSTKTYTLSRDLTVGDTLLYTTSYDAIKTLSTAPAFIMGADLTLRKVSTIIAFPPSGTTNWWSGANQVGRATGPTEAQAILKTAWNNANPGRPDGVWPAGTVISVPANVSEADVNAPLMYYTVYGTAITGIPWANINERFDGVTGALTTDGTRSYYGYDSLRVQVSIIPQGNALEFVSIALEHLSQTDFEKLKSQYFTKVEVDTDFIRKADYVNYGYTKAQVYTKVESDANYYRKSDVNTKAEVTTLIGNVTTATNQSVTSINTQITDIRNTYATTANVASVYYTKASADALKTALESFATGVGTTVTNNVAATYYTKVQADARYHGVASKTIAVAPTDGLSTSLTNAGISFAKDGSTGSTFTRDTVGVDYIFRINGFYGPDTAAKGDFIRIGTASVWTNAYGNLHEYFAKAAETYSKVETYSKAEVYTKTESDNLYISKSITTLKLPKFEIDYTAATLAAAATPGYSFNIPGVALNVRATVTGGVNGISFTGASGAKFFTVGVDGSILSNGVNIADIYASRADTYTKVQVDSNINTLKQDTMGVAVLNDKFSKIYTKAESDSLFATSTSVAAMYLTKSSAASTYLTSSLAATTYAIIGASYTKEETYPKGDVFTKTESYSRSQADARYEYIGIAYTKAQSDAKYATIAAYYTKTETEAKFYDTAQSNARYYTKLDIAALNYSKSESDARYINYTDPIITVNSTSNSMYGAGVVINGTSTDISGSVIWQNAGVRSGMWYTSGGNTSFSKMNMYLRDANATWNAHLTIDYAGIWHKTYGNLHEYFAKAADTYSKSEVYVKADVYTKAQSDSNYYSKVVGDARYEYMGVAYTKAQSDSNYYSKTEADNRYYQKSVTYTRVESDDRYLASTNIPEITGISSSPYALGLLIRNNHATSSHQGGIQWYNKTVRTGLLYVLEPTTADMSSRMGIYLNDPVTGSNVSTAHIDSVGIWHKAYGYLDDYFVTSATVYNRNAVYTKAEADAKYDLKNSSYTKAQSDANYYTKAVGDDRYEYMGVAYTKAQSDAKYDLKGTSYTKAEGDARYINYTDQLVKITGIQTDTYRMGIELNNNHTTSDDGSSILWNTRSVRSAMWHVTGGSVTASQMNLYLRHTDAVWGAAFNVTTSRIWHKTYGYLDAYFAKVADYYTKAQGDVRYVLDNTAINTNNGVFAASGRGTPNCDHMWHDDGKNNWHFCSDIAEKSIGNANLVANSIQVGDGIGADVPKIAYKLLTNVIKAGTKQSTIPHGLDVAKIMSTNGQVNNLSGSIISCNAVGNSVVITSFGEAVSDTPCKVLITYMV